MHYSPTTSTSCRTPDELSREAYDSIVDHLPAMRRRVYDFIKSTGSRGATGDDVAAHFGRFGTINGRTKELHRMGLITPIGERKTRSGRMATVYVDAFLGEVA